MRKYFKGKLMCIIYNEIFVLLALHFNLNYIHAKCKGLRLGVICSHINGNFFAKHYYKFEYSVNG